MSRERITISIRRGTLSEIDKIIDGDNIRNRSHAIEHLILNASGSKEDTSIVFLLGGEDIENKIDVAKIYIKQAKELGISKFFVATGSQSELVEKTLGDGSKFNIHIVYQTGDGTGSVIRLLKNSLHSTFIVVNTADKNIRDISELFSFHKKLTIPATLFTKDEHTFSGIYIFEPEVIDHIKRGYSMIEEDLLPVLLKKNMAVATYL